jgi:predicted O-methyltransferase YrrM
MAAFMLSCPARAAVCARTLRRLAATDWGRTPTLVVDDTRCERRQDRQEQTARRMLQRAISEAGDADLLLLLEDDLEFNRHLRHNLACWPPVADLHRGDHFFGSIYDPGVHRRSAVDRHCWEADPDAVYGSQAFVIAPATARYVEERWDEVAGMQDIRISRLAAAVCPVLYHAPSLVQHVGEESVWGGPFHTATDYDAAWCATGEADAAAEPTRPPRKALVTLGAGDHADLLLVSLPTFERYAERHGYELVVGTGEEAMGRPMAWAKVPLLRRTLAEFDVALWIDADAVVVDAEADVADALEPSAFQAMVEHRTPQGDCPNTGVWLLRSCAAGDAFLDAVWDSSAAIDHPWWENAAACTALGYELEPTCRRSRDTEFLHGTQWLPTEWNSIPKDRATRPRIAHFPGEPVGERLAALRAAVGLEPAPRLSDVRRLALERMAEVDGWLSDEEANLLLRAAVQALGDAGAAPVVEVGSMWGRSTVVLATAVATLAPATRVHAIGPHEGEITVLEGGTTHFAPTLDAFEHNLARAGLRDVVAITVARATETQWTSPISLLFVDGLHDEHNVRADTGHFLPWVARGGLVALHDYGYQFPGVRTFVDDLVARQEATVWGVAGSLVVLEPRAG